jgi:hypothetical protein
MKKIVALAILLGASTSLAIAAEPAKPAPPVNDATQQVKPGVMPLPEGGRENAMGKRFEELLKAADTNGDHAVDEQEFTAFTKKKADERFDKLDTNKDGSLSKQEFEAGGRDEHRAFEMLDRNKDGKIDAADLEMPRPPMPMHNDDHAGVPKDGKMPPMPHDGGPADEGRAPPPPQAR